MLPTKLILLAATFTCFTLVAFSQKQQYKQTDNVVYGMVSGTALLMDVYQPSSANDKAILYIPGSGFGIGYEDHYNQFSLKDDVILDSAYTGKWVHALVEKGYTVFVINHRFTPRFQFADIFNDCKQAVRYIRSHAKQYNVDPVNIGAMGHSSGGNLSSLLGTADENHTTAKGKEDSISFRVQAVVALATPFDLSDYNRLQDTAIIFDLIEPMQKTYLGSLPAQQNGQPLLTGIYADASPLALVSKEDAPTLIYYSDNDPLIPTRQSQNMYKILQKNHVPTAIFLSSQSVHNPIPDMNEVDKWFKKYLKK